MEIKNSKLKWIYLIGFFLILALPLLNLPPWFSPPDWGKIIIFRIIFAILIFLFICQILYQKEEFSVVQRIVQRVSATKTVFWIPIALFGIFLLATIFSLDRNFSLWESPYRAGGFITFAFYILFAILTFVILEKSDWQKIWNFILIIGTLVSVVAIFQQFGLFSKVFVSISWRPPSTIGGAIFLAIYLLLLSFLVLGFGIKEKKCPKKFFYFFIFLLFLFVIIFLTKTRAVYLGLGTGFLYFVFFYPHTITRTSSANFITEGDMSSFGVGTYPKKVIYLKVLTLILLILGICEFYFLKTHPEISLFKEYPLLQQSIDRIINIPLKGDPSRISTWKISLEAIKNRPILGYGPENFSIGFDKYYDAGLPGVHKLPYYHPSSWWDRAHNFIFDIGVCAGIPALIIYLSLFAVLFWQLQTLKHKDVQKSMTILYHGIQATFLAYLTANFFSFDTFSSYIILFLLISYSLFLIAEKTPVTAPKNTGQFSSVQRIVQHWFSDKISLTRIYSTIIRWKKTIIILLLVILIFFIWNYNLKPFRINKEINLALLESKAGYCEAALARMEKVLPSRSSLDNYLRLKYIDVIEACIREKSELGPVLAQKAVEIMKENIKIRPYYTRNWLLLGSYTNILIEAGRENLKDEVNYYFERAFELSPKRQETLFEWIKADLLTGEYQKAKEKAQKCIDLNPEVKDCYWFMALSNIYLGDTEETQKNMEIFTQIKCESNPYTCGTNSKPYLLQLAKAYGDTKNYQALLEIYQKLISQEPGNAQYYASLAFVYKELGDIENAKKYALIVLEIMPEAKEDVEKFLQMLE